MIPEKKILNKHYDLILCDSKDALQFCYKNGLSKQIKVISCSPGILLDNTINSENIFQNFTKKKYIQYQKSIFDFTLKLYNVLLQDKSFDKEIATLVAILGNHISNFLLKISQINYRYFNKKILFIKIGDDLPNSYLINPPWDYINKILKITTFQYIPKDYTNINIYNEQRPSFFKRVLLGGWETVIYRILIKLNKKIFYKKKSIIIANENEIIIELVASLFLKGYKINDFRSIKLDNSCSQIKNVKKLKRHIYPILRKRLNYWVKNDFINICEKYFYEELLQRVNYYSKWKFTFRNIFKDIGRKDNYKVLALANHPSSPKGLALKNACNYFNILHCSCQHGVTAELSASHDYCLSQHDSSSSDVYLAFNPGSAKVGKLNPFKTAKSLVYGAPKRYNRTKYNLFFKNKYEILYLSNNLFAGNISGLSVWADDLEKAKTEITILNLLNKINKKVFYKPYPEINKRYYESNPCLQEANELENINIIKNNYDARYYLNESNLLICPSASSTVSWALMSEIPTIFINFKNIAPLNIEAYSAFKKGIFLFDYDDKKFSNHLTAFLNKSLKEINSLWNKKRFQRQELISSFISGKKENNISKIFF